VNARSSARRRAVLIAGWLLAASAGACDRGAARGSASGVGSASPPPSGLAPLPVSSIVPVPGNAPTSFADLVALADPGVVFVKTQHEKRTLPGRRVLGEALGSAFVYDSDGLILTNNHVIEGAADIQVTLGTSRVLSATVVGRDPPTDVAVLRVDAKGLPALPIGDSDAARVGDWVIAIGNPFGLSHTVSAGIISAKDRTNQDLNRSGGGLNEEGYYDFLQTDASINPGNSGGPLLDTSGRVVGINTAIRGGANNIGFAIPINMVREILPRLLRDGKIERSALGVVVSPVLPDDVGRLKLAGAGGALVNRVVPGGPADRAGLAADDVVLAFNGRAISRPERLRWAASLAGVGSSATVHVSRGGRQFDIKVALGELPASAAAPGEP